jgi:hypothetical protein
MGTTPSGPGPDEREHGTTGKHHVVAQGEHLPGIAKRHGFSDYRTIWLHVQNASLKTERQNPNVLFPDDRVFIPDKQLKQEPRPTDQRHRFRVERPPLKLRLILEDVYEKPIANAECELRVEGETRAVTTNAQGRIEQDIAPDAQHAILIIKDAQTPITEIRIPIKIGHLDPENKVSGQKARLNNLGYFAGPEDNRSEEENRTLFVSAVEEFQCEHGLTVDGKCGPSTQAKLKQVHGC